MNFVHDIRPFHILLYYFLCVVIHVLRPGVETDELHRNIIERIEHCLAVESCLVGDQGVEDAVYETEDVCAELALSGADNTRCAGSCRNDADDVVVPVDAENDNHGTGSCEPANLPDLPAAEFVFY